VQLTTGGLKAYLNAVTDAFADDIHYGILHKVYGADRHDAARYNLAECLDRENRGAWVS
jgi:hypothetical protein